MKLLLDNIIFSLQKAGGISVVWSENLKRLANDNDIDFKCLDYLGNNIFSKSIKLPEDKLIIKNPRVSLQIERYLSPDVTIKDKTIFHSSYYRSLNDPKVHNITTVHDFTYEYYRKGLPKFIHKTQKYKSIYNSKTIICVSENTKLDLLKFCPGISEEKIKVIYNGVDKDYKVVNENVDFIPFENGGYLLYVGDRKSIYKNFKMAVEASSKVSLPLVIVGGVLSKNEKKYLNTTLRNNYILLSGISNKELNLLYNNAFCFLYPTTYEGFGIPLLEAQRAGCPVISSNISSIPEAASMGLIPLCLSASGVDEFIRSLNLKWLNTHETLEELRDFFHSLKKLNDD